MQPLPAMTPQGAAPSLPAVTPSSPGAPKFSNNALFFVGALIFLMLCTAGAQKPTGPAANGQVEKFWAHRYYYPYRYCNNCGKQSKWSCSKCKNCGFCVPYKGRPECVPGDATGPYFRKDCMVWDYGSPKYYYPHMYPYRYWYTDGRWRHGRRRNYPWRYRRGPHRLRSRGHRHRSRGDRSRGSKSGSRGKK